MDWYIKAFIRASLVWFTAGILLGIGLAVVPSWIAYRPAHAHMNLVGFLTMLLFGVGYQLLPRLFGHPLRYPRLAVVHLYCANVGLAGMVLGFLSAPLRAAATSAGGVIYGVGALLWVFNLWRTFDAADARNRARLSHDHQPLPTLQE